MLFIAPPERFLQDGIKEDRYHHQHFIRSNSLSFGTAIQQRTYRLALLGAEAGFRYILQELLLTAYHAQSILRGLPTAYALLAYRNLPVSSTFGCWFFAQFRAHYKVQYRAQIPFNVWKN